MPAPTNEKTPAAAATTNEGKATTNQEEAMSNLSTALESFILSAALSAATENEPASQPVPERLDQLNLIQLERVARLLRFPFGDFLAALGDELTVTTDAEHLLRDLNLDALTNGGAGK